LLFFLILSVLSYSFFFLDGSRINGLWRNNKLHKLDSVELLHDGNRAVVTGDALALDFNNNRESQATATATATAGMQQ
jgi:hypothetical protein